MSTSESLPQPSDNLSDQTITIQPSGVAVYPASEEWPQTASASDASHGAGAQALLHALRRHWLLALSCGLACSAVAGALLYYFCKPQYKAVAQIYLSPSNGNILQRNGERRGDDDPIQFEIFRETQQQIVKSRFVLTAALRNPKLRNQPSIQREETQHNAINWLAEELKVDFLSKNAGVMQVSITLPDRFEAAQIVNSVVEAYSDEAANEDLKSRRIRLNELQKLYAEKESDLRQKRTDLTNTEEQLGAIDDKTAGLKTQLALQNYGEFQRELTKMKFEKQAAMRRRGQLEIEMQSLPEVSDSEVTMILQNNQEFVNLQARKNILESIMKNVANNAVQGSKKPPSLRRTGDELDGTNAQLSSLKALFADGIRSARRLENEREMRKLKSQVDILTEQYNAFNNEVDKAKKEAEQVGKSFVEVQMMRAEVENIERLLKGVSEEREQVKVELRSQARVRIPSDPPADVPEVEAGRVMRFTLIGFGSIVALCLPGIAIFLWDFRLQRINASSDVSKRLGITVMGGVPKIPARVMRRLGATTRKNQIWKLRFTESVDSVTGRLLRKAECDQTRVVLITSAVSGEGKTTLATQIAMSLARHHRRTVLVDFDLRRPTLDGALGLAPSPGVCDALRGQGDILTMVQATDTECLSVVVAGRWDRGVLSALSSGSVSGLLEQLRASFDFVIIDSSPLLPIVDTRLVSQHVDAVVLSVFRDVSQGPKIIAAREILEAFGVRSIEAVVTGGGSQHGYGKNHEYEASTLAEQDMAVVPENPVAPHDTRAPA